MSVTTSTVAPVTTAAVQGLFPDAEVKAVTPVRKPLPLTGRAKSPKAPPAPKTATDPKAKAPRKAAAAPTTGKFTNHSKNEFRAADLGDFKQGDKVTLKAKDGTWTVQGPAQGGTTLKVTQDRADGTTVSLFRFARNLTPVK